MTVLSNNNQQKLLNEDVEIFGFICSKNFPPSFYCWTHINNGWLWKTREQQVLNSARLNLMSKVYKKVPSQLSIRIKPSFQILVTSQSSKQNSSQCTRALWVGAKTTTQLRISSRANFADTVLFVFDFFSSYENTLELSDLYIM